MPLPPARTRFLAAALLPILLATLWPFPGHEPEGFISCIACGEHATSDVLLNIILFVPLGAAVALHVRSLSRCALSAALLSATIELAQLYIPGRDSSLGDVLSNTLGGTLGAPVPHCCPRRRRRVLGHGHLAHSNLSRCAVLRSMDPQPRASGAVPRPRT